MKTLCHLTLFALALADPPRTPTRLSRMADFLAISLTNLQWLTPVYTRGQTSDNAIVPNIINEHGFRYAVMLRPPK